MTDRPTRPRNVELERVLTNEAARGHADPERLILHAETRAMRLHGEYTSDPMLVDTTRNRPCEVREEIADARNHVIWWIEDNLGDEEIARAGMECLRDLTRAYARLADH